LRISSTGRLDAADAPFANVNDNPAAPKTGTALLRRFCFAACLARDMIDSPAQISGAACQLKAFFSHGVEFHSKSSRVGRIKKLIPSTTLSTFRVPRAAPE
jgi:hypothetical protein